ncbi:winged helix-turn-helix domain-containing protein [Streptomyces desertarenae]|uniref:Winged helix-turn-helix domain-containing protein n=1 Tax=Streptomyces desertarenae TaxID=2666184 RepID=A0ABW4PNR2_9ACTN
MDEEPVIPLYAYERLAADLEAEIASGRLPVGARLEGEREMADMRGVSLNTVRSALKLLRERGLVAMKPGAGTFVIRSRRPDTP